MQENDGIKLLKEFSEESQEAEHDKIDSAIKVKKEKHSTCETSSLISDKYMEDIKANTVANRFSDMIIDFEKNFPVDDANFEALDQHFYVEDDIFQSEDEDEANERNDEDSESWSYLATIKKETGPTIAMLMSGIQDLCKCEIEKKISIILHFTYELESFQPQNNKLIAHKNTLLHEFKECVSSSRETFKSMKGNCHHEVNILQNEYTNIIEEGGNIDVFVGKKASQNKGYRC